MRPGSQHNIRTDYGHPITAIACPKLPFIVFPSIEDVSPLRADGSASDRRSPLTLFSRYFSPTGHGKLFRVQLSIVRNFHIISLSIKGQNILLSGHKTYP